MKRILQIEIDCGETTCASEPGKFCRWRGSRGFGTVPICALFATKNDTYTDLEDMDGWVRRCQQCLDAETITDE